MASLDQIIRMNENAYRVPDKMQKSKGVRKPLGDVTNSSKPLGKHKSPAKPSNGFKVQQKVLTSTKAGRKPLSDVSNSNKLRQKEVSSKKYCTENLSVVSENLQVDNWGFGEGFLHDHNKCIEAQSQSTAMSMDYFLETVGLKKDSSLSELPKLSVETKSELEIGELEMMDEFLPSPHEPMSPPTPKSPRSEMCWMNVNFELKDSPPRN